MGENLAVISAKLHIMQAALQWSKKKIKGSWVLSEISGKTQKLLNALGVSIA